MSVIKKSLNIFVAGFGCCKQEIFASGGPLYDIQRFGINFVNFHSQADVLIVQGLHNRQSLENVISIYNEMGNRKWVIAVGSCVLNKNIFSRDGGLFREFREKIKIDIFVPGCPPRPEAFMYALLRLIEKA